MMVLGQLTQYFKERMANASIALLWLWLLAGVWLTTQPHRGGGGLLAISGAVCALFVLALRLSDDLADRIYDRQQHPRRSLPHWPNIRIFYVSQALLLAALISLVAWHVGSMRALALCAALVALQLMYCLTDQRPDLRSMRTACVLLKYPVLIFVLSARPQELFTLCVALLAYLPPLWHELRSSGAAVIRPAAVCVGLSTLAWFYFTHGSL